ncbi:MAG: hypothetical protein E6Q50_14075 [Lysobacter sp.]|nr:MAG: hypothetical protein E6Q50_14075 [Lysobacter sp.]
MQAQPPSADVMSRRFRNRVIDCLEIAADPECHVMFGPASIVNWWGDWREAALGPPPAASLSKDELAAVVAFDAAWETLVADTPDPMPDLSALSEEPSWRCFVTCARTALDLLSRTGRLREE